MTHYHHRHHYHHHDAASLPLPYVSPQPLMPLSQSIYSNTPYTTYDYSPSLSSASLVSFSQPQTAYGNIYDPYHPITVGGYVQPRIYSGASYMPHFARLQYPNQAFGTFHQIKFRRKGAFSSGITLAEAQTHMPLAYNDYYTIYDLNPNHNGSILLSVTWNGYPPMTYEIPLDGYSGRISLETLARRISRACIQYLQSYGIPVAWDCIELHHIEEIAYGVWKPMLIV